MSGKGISVDQPRRLPIQVPPRPGETPNSFIKRLATVNHLRPSRLRTYLNDPPGQTGPLQAWRLAAVTGLTVEELTRTMPKLEPVDPSRPKPRYRTQTQLLTALRRAALHDHDVKQLSQQFAVPRPTIIKALTSQTSTIRFQYQQPQRNPILEETAGYLDQLIADNPDATIWSIWKRLGEEQQTRVCYGTIRNYVNRVRAQPTDSTSVKYLVSRADLFARIRDDASGDLVTRLAAEFSVDDATVVRALTGHPPEANRDSGHLH